ncbi:ComEC/Rec2 family competence protein [Myroides sp. LoEW2-1]|uniref:ComEC/Rec2 family competence protein n=1 Tax=Myroides sp. LoEW2-1 TaxID=2683192 RepID=UPI001AA1128B|nr:ComEC/Rec2 family competence protein [Myroides sp. LoEW2-1]
MLWCFVFLSGFSPPVYRAVLMFSVISLSVVLSRDSKLEYSIGIALVLSLIFEPLLLYNVSFQMSYVAVLSIVFLLPILRKFRSKYKVLNYFIDITFVSIVVQIGLLPLQLFYFQQFTFAFFIGNLLAIPAVTVILLLAILVVCSIVFTGRFYLFLDVVFNASLDLFLGLVSKLQLVEFLVFKEAKVSSLAILLYFGCIVLLYWCWKLKNRWSFAFLLIWCNASIYALILERKNTATDCLLMPYTSRRESPEIVVYQNSKLIHQFGISDATTNKIIPYLDWKILVLHEHSPFYLNDIAYDYLIVIGNAKVNYDRLFSECTFLEVVISSNTPTWLRELIKKSCLKHNIPFHDIYEKGYWELSV